MKYLLDTHCWLWLQSNRKRLASMIERFSDPANELLLSAASAWEISIKYALGKLPLPLPPAEYVPSRMRSSGTLGLPVHHAHALHVSTLPHHHADPFDRLLIAQAQCEGLPIVTVDPAFAAYDVEVLRP
ncbi:type II toxin-antitoxin system VapC family toxin [Pendulispora albinea]|uniref:Type II toxin-antitoxin system VapC family toxin n=1 Tax=Pendulispora albinea TaxID=2741071 RepID=A0ABZ2M3Q9_9BACT